MSGARLSVIFPAFPRAGNLKKIEDSFKWSQVRAADLEGFEGNKKTKRDDPPGRIISENLAGPARFICYLFFQNK